MLDTGSPWVWVSSDTCSNCRTGVVGFDANSSTTYSKDKFYEKELLYGSGNIYGHASVDSLCITKDSCGSDFKFLLGEKQSGLSFLRSAGVVGLSPGR